MEKNKEIIERIECPIYNEYSNGWRIRSPKECSFSYKRKQYQCNAGECDRKNRRGDTVETCCLFCKRCFDQECKLNWDSEFSPLEVMVWKEDRKQYYLRNKRKCQK